MGVTNLKDRKEIEKDAMQLETPPADYNLLEIQCFLALKQLLVMYWNKQISSENASKTKQLIFSNYEKNYKQFDFEASMFKEKVVASNRTSGLRIELHNKLKQDDEITVERLAEVLNIALEIISITYKENF